MSVPEREDCRKSLQLESETHVVHSGMAMPPLEEFAGFYVLINRGYFRPKLIERIYPISIQVIEFANG